MTEKPISAVTHGITSIFHGKNDGIKRQTSLFKTDDGRFSFEFVTHWDGEDKEPARTWLNLGQEAFESITTLILEFHFNLSNYAVQNNTEQQIEYVKTGMTTGFDIGDSEGDHTVLFIVNINPELEKKEPSPPDLKVDDLVWVWNDSKKNKKIRCFAGFTDNQKILAWNNGETSVHNTITFEWEHWEKYQPE